MIRYMYVPINDVRSGMVIGSTIEDCIGRPLIVKGTALTSYQIQELKSLGVEEITVQYGKDEDVDPDKILSPLAQHRVAAMRRPDPPKVTLEATMKKRIAAGIALIYKDPDPTIISHTSKKIADDLMATIDKNNAIALNINDLKTSDEYTFKHSVDVATIAMIIAKHKKMTKSQVRDIGMAGLLHDIGKTKVPNEILNKPAKLTPDEFSIMKMHSTFSYEMIKHNPDINADIARAVLQHHEKMDGSGYPDGVTAENIHPYARILTLADIYDALVTDRPYKKGIAAGQAVEILMSMADQLDMADLKSFLSTMILYPVDSIVELSNGEKARVVRKNPNFILRPMVVGVKSGNIYDLGDMDHQNLVIL